MKHLGLLVVFVLCFFGCKDSGQEPTTINGFKDVFLERGSDSDETYRSLRTQRQSDGSLKVVITGWAIRETGLFLSVEILESNPMVLRLQIMGECGTVQTRTPIKTSFAYSLQPLAEDGFRQIEFGFEESKLIVRK